MERLWRLAGLCWSTADDNLASAREPEVGFLTAAVSWFGISSVASLVKVDSLMAFTLISTTAGLTTDAAAVVRFAGDFKDPVEPEAVLVPTDTTLDDRLEGLDFRAPSWADGSSGTGPLEECRLPLRDLASVAVFSGGFVDLLRSKSTRVGVGVGSACRGLFVEMSSVKLSSPESVTISFTLPTDVLNLLYSPLKPPFNSLTSPLSSPPEDDDGGDVYSLKVVRASL